MNIRSLLVFLLVLAALMAGLQAKSLPKAMLMSAVLPGTGEIYTGELTRGIALITTDMVLLFTADRYANQVDWLQQSSRQYAFAKAGIPSDFNSAYFSLLPKWYSSSDYNAAVELYFRNEGIYNFNNPDYYIDMIDQYTVPDSQAWQWASKKDWNKYISIRHDKQKQLMNQKLAIGALIADRVISVLDTVFLVKKYNNNHHPEFSLTPDFINNGATLNCRLEF